MPRSSLPSHLKNMQTMEVLLTQTTEDEVRSHIKNLFLAFENSKDKYTKRISSVVTYFSDKNPYLNHNWKKGKPNRLHKEVGSWFGTDENERQEYSKYNSLNKDILLISKNFDWEELDDMKFEFEKFNSHIHTAQEDIFKLEDMCFRQSKNKFEEENKEWVEEQKEIGKHKSCPFSTYELRLMEDEGKSIEEHLKCKYCKINFDRAIEISKKAREYEANKPLINIVFEEAKVEEVCNVKLPELKCEDCGYKTTNKRVFEEHFKLQSHKLASWYCKVCEVQSRTELEHKNHITTKKHEKKVNGEHEYICEKCNYKTLLKSLFDQHNTTKKHLENCL